MLDGLLGRGFASKCKSSIKLTTARIDVIRRKRNATVKFLKKDIADLLTNHLDDNAYGRAEGLLVEMVRSSCYDFVDRSCQSILQHLSVMQKQSECPEECKIAISSLMFAAARFSDLPELRDLRHAFEEKYGNSLDFFVNKEFVENLKSLPSTMEKKVNLLQEIASESNIKWDSRGFELRMHEPPSNQRKPNVSDNKYKLASSEDKRYEFHNGNAARPARVVHEHANGSEKIEDSQLFGTCVDKNKLPSRRELTFPKEDNHGIPFRSRHEMKEEHVSMVVGSSSYVQRPEHIGDELHNDKETLPRLKPGHAAKIEKLDCSSQVKDLENKLHYGRENILPKKDGKETFPHGEFRDAVHNRDGHEKMQKASFLPPPPYRIKSGSDRHNVINMEPVRMNNGPDKSHRQDETNNISRRRSSRRRDDNDGGIERVAEITKTGSRRREKSKQGLQILIDENKEHRRPKDEDEIIMDKLLLHYSKKPSSSNPEKLRLKLKDDRVHRSPGNARTQVEGVHDTIPPARSVSLPHEEASRLGAPKVFSRAVSEHGTSNPACHVHPKLPDYDDLAARFASLKGR